MNVISRIEYYVTKALKEPELIKPFLENQTYSLICELITKKHEFFLEDQKELIEEFRESEDYLLIILDACRYDALLEKAPEYFDEVPKPVINEARNTFEYGASMWSDGFYSVKYVSGAVPINSKALEFDEESLNSLYDGYVPAEYLLNIVDAWAEAWDDDLGVAPPEKITEIALREEENPMVVHYFQPHTPFIGEKRELGYTEGENAMPGKGKPVDHIIWERVKNGEISKGELEDLYTSNLGRVLDSVQELIGKTDHENIVITADHGEALGEYSFYAHPEHINHPKVRVVPWLEIE